MLVNAEGFHQGLVREVEARVSAGGERELYLGRDSNRRIVGIGRFLLQAHSVITIRRIQRLVDAEGQIEALISGFEILTVLRRVSECGGLRDSGVLSVKDPHRFNACEGNQYNDKNYRHYRAEGSFEFILSVPCELSGLPESVDCLEFC